MKTIKDYITALEAAHLFKDSGHLTRFKELMDCFFHFPFFTKGLCKCMYLSAWDNDHFAIMLQTLNEMSLGMEQNTNDMRIQGDLLAQKHTGGEYYIYQLSNAFLDNAPFQLDDTVCLDDTCRHIISQALKASEIIDHL